MYPAGVAGIRVHRLRLRTGVELRVAESGPEGAGVPAVLLLHGWGASLYMHRHALHEMAFAGYRVLAPDLRGHGLSDKPLAKGSYHADVFRDDVVALLDAAHVERAAIVAQSMGGAIALDVARRVPTRVPALVLINSAGLVSSLYPRLGRSVPRVLARRLGTRLPRTAIAWILRGLVYGDPTRLTEPDVDEYWAPSADPNFVVAMHRILLEFDWEPRSSAELAAIHAPTLIIAGESDRFFRGSESMAHAFPAARAIRLRGGHSVNEECGTESCEAILDFLRERWPPSASFQP